MLRFSGIWEHPQSTIPAILAGAAGIAVALNWTDADTAGRYSTLIGSFLVALIGALYKPKTQ